MGWNFSFMNLGDLLFFFFFVFFLFFLFCFVHVFMFLDEINKL